MAEVKNVIIGAAKIGILVLAYIGAKVQWKKNKHLLTSKK